MLIRRRIHRLVAEALGASERRYSFVRQAALFLLIVLPFGTTFGQSPRPLPHPVVPPPAFERAVSHETRTESGAPGPRIWRNYASYEIDAVLSPATRTLRATGSVTYSNHSPGHLDRLYLHLRQNLHRPDARRTRRVPLTEGVALSRVSVAGTELVQRPTLGHAGYHVDGTILRIELPTPLLPGESVHLDLAWSFEVPGLGAPRMGQDGDVFFLAFWYPQMAVYDDVNGWTAEQYLGQGEFYMGFADYDVRITLPSTWLVAATGNLQNAGEILRPWVHTRLAQAAGADDVVRVVAEAERDTATMVSATGTHTWHFRTEQVRDFAFGASNRYVWDATSAQLEDGRVVAAHAFYRPERPAWERAAEYVKWSVEHLSRQVVPYPYLHMTAAEGIISGGMEYPMLTLVGGSRTPVSLFRVIYHEVAHVWYPMLVSTNEHEYGWMDEGLVSLLSEDAQEAFWGDQALPMYEAYYTSVAGTGREREIMRPTEEFHLTDGARRSSLYGKPMVALRALREMVGEERFHEALRTYTRRWIHQHPTPYDFFNTFDDVLEEDFGWFWSSMFFETWTMDHAIAHVRAGAGEVRVDVEDLGLLPMPAVVRVTYRDGRKEERTVPVDRWLGGARSAEVVFPGGEVEVVELDPRRAFPDLNRENDVWRPAEGALR